MKSRVRIGAGNQIFDRISLGVQLFIVVFFAVMALKFEDAIYIALCFFAAASYESLKIFKRNYIFLEGSYFAIESVIGKKVIISIDLYKDVLSPTVGTSLPLSNQMIIEFKDGRQFRFMGGTSTVSDLQHFIKSAMNSHT